MKRIKYIMFLIIAWCIGISNIERVGNLAEVHAANMDVSSKQDLMDLLNNEGKFKGLELQQRQEILKGILEVWWGSKTQDTDLGAKKLINQELLDILSEVKTLVRCSKEEFPGKMERSYFPQKELPCIVEQNGEKYWLSLSEDKECFLFSSLDGKELYRTTSAYCECKQENSDERVCASRTNSFELAEVMLPAVSSLLDKLQTDHGRVTTERKDKLMQLATPVAALYLAAICQENVIYSVVDNDCVCNDSSGEYRLRNLQTMMSSPQNIIDYLKHLQMCSDIYVKKCGRDPKTLLKLFLASPTTLPNVGLDENQTQYKNLVRENFLKHIRKHWLDAQRLREGVDGDAYNSEISGFVCSPSYKGDLAQFAIDKFMNDSDVNMKMSLRTVDGLLYPAIKTSAGENLFTCDVQIPGDDSFYVRIAKADALALSSLVNEKKSNLTGNAIKECKTLSSEVHVDTAKAINQVQLFFNLCLPVDVNAQKCDFGSFYATQIAS